MKCVFVVDDDPNAQGVKRLLREYGYEKCPVPGLPRPSKHDDFEEAFCVILTST